MTNKISGYRWIVVGCLASAVGAVIGKFAGLFIGFAIVRLLPNGGFWGPDALEMEVLLDGLFIGIVGGSILGLIFGSFLMREAEHQRWFALGLTIFVVLCVVSGFGLVILFNTEEYDDGTFHPRSHMMIPWSMWVWFAIAGWAFVKLMARLARFRRSKIRSRSGLCVNCGYDLRATRDRCPECGRDTKVDFEIARLAASLARKRGR